MKTDSVSPEVDLSSALTPRRASPGVFQWSAPDGWQQGRGAFGGLVLGALARAIDAEETERDRVLRSLSGEITGPVLATESRIEVQPLRRGTGVSTYDARLVQSGEILARVSAVLGRHRAIDTRFPSPEVPAMPPYERCAVAPVAPPLGPVFAQHFEFRPTGPLPYTGASVAESAGWIRPHVCTGGWDAARVIACADAWWPAGFALETAPRPIGTVSFTLQYLPPERPLGEDEPLFHRARVIAAQGGFVVEFRELWRADGTLLALNQQTFVWIK